MFESKWRFDFIGNCLKHCFPGSETVLWEECPPGPPGAQWDLAWVHPPPPPPAQEGRQGPDQLRGLHLPPFPRPANPPSPAEGGCEGLGQGGAGTSENRGRERGGMLASKSCCHTGLDSLFFIQHIWAACCHSLYIIGAWTYILISGCDTEHPPEAGWWAEKRGRSSNGDVRLPAAAKEAIAFLVPRSCRGRIRHGPTKSGWGQQQTQNQPGDTRRIKSSLFIF